MRWLNVVLACFALYVFLSIIFLRWRTMTRTDRLVQVGFAVLLVSAMLGSIEAQTQNLPLGYRVFLVAVNLMYLSVALLVDHRARRRTSA